MAAKQKEEDLDGELENVDGVAELRKWTEAKTSLYGKNSAQMFLERFQLFILMWCMIQQWKKYLLFLIVLMFALLPKIYSIVYEKRMLHVSFK